MPRFPVLAPESRRLALLYLLLVLPALVVLAVATPLGQVADEPAHAIRAAALLRGEVIGHRVVETAPDGREVAGAGLDEDPAVVWACFLPREPGAAFDRAAWDFTHTLRWTGQVKFLQISPVAIYMPAFYVPAAVGLGIAKRLGAGPARALLAGRLANVLCFAAAAALALALARRGHGLLFCTLAFPMTLSLGASFNQDGLLIAASALAAALLTRVRDDGAPGGRVAFRAATALIALVATVKPPYLPLALLLLFPLPRREGGLLDGRALRRRAGAVALVALPALAWTGYALAFVAAPAERAPYHPGPLWTGDPALVLFATDPAAQFGVLLRHPALMLTLPLHGLFASGQILREAVGVLGWLNVALPAWLYAAWFWAVPAAALGDRVGPVGGCWVPRAVDVLGLLAGAATCVFAVYLSQYLSWTEVGADRITGVTGRYLLPVLPMLAVALPRFGLRRGGGAALPAAVAGPALAAAAGLVSLPTLIVVRWYLR